ncbi:hypothetical protein N9A86_03010 [Akkermansiaceae bacterium]|nr:hypothetical protein [Akkermansiaceae bacterium]
MDELRGERELTVICDDKPDPAVELDAELAVGGVAQLDLDEGNFGCLPDFVRWMIFSHPGRMAPICSACEIVSGAAAAPLTLQMNF